MLFMREIPNAKRPNAKEISTDPASFELLYDCRKDQLRLMRLLPETLSLLISSGVWTFGVWDFNSASPPKASPPD
jgi:hypothetical protein